MFLKKQIRHQIETELELHFLFNHLLLEDELSRLEKEVSELDKNLTMNAKVQNLLNLSKQTHDHFEQTKESLNQIEKEAREAGFKDFSLERLEKVTREYIKSDDYFESRIILAIKLIFSLPNKFNSASKKESFKKISTLLAFPHAKALEDIETSLKANYKDISLSNKVDKEELIKVGVVTSLVVAGLVGVVTLPFMGLGGALATNLITTTSISVASGIAASGVLYVMKTKVNDAKIVEEFNNLTPDELAYMLAFNATLVAMMKRMGVSVESSAIKKRLDIFVKLSNQINIDFYLKQQQIESNSQKKKMMAKCDHILLNTF